MRDADIIARRRELANRDQRPRVRDLGGGSSQLVGRACWVLVTGGPSQGPGAYTVSVWLYGYYSADGNARAADETGVTGWAVGASEDAVVPRSRPYMGIWRGAFVEFNIEPVRV